MKPHPLPLLETLYKSIAWPWHCRKQLGLALLPSFLALTCLEFASLYTPTMNEGKGTWLFALISLPFGILYTITIHRFLILGPASTPRLGVFEWQGREWNFLFYTIVLSILLGIMVAIPLMVLFGSAAGSGQSVFRAIIMLIVCLPALLMFARLSLVFPAIAIDSNFSLAAVWQAGKGNTFRLAVIVYWMPAGAAILDYFLPDNQPQYVEAVVIVTWVLLSYALWAIEIACLSFAYKYLVAPTGAADRRSAIFSINSGDNFDYPDSTDCMFNSDRGFMQLFEIQEDCAACFGNASLVDIFNTQSLVGVSCPR